MNSIQKKILGITAILLLASCFDGSNNQTRFKNAHFGSVIDYHTGETYSAELLNRKFIDVVNGNLGGQGFNTTEGKDGPSQGSIANQNHLVSQFLDQNTQPDELLHIAKYAVKSYSFLYNTPGVNYKTDSSDFKHTVSGLLLVPHIPTSQIKGVVLYFHGTESVKNSVPSCTPTADFTSASPTNFSYCNVNSENFNKQYIAKFAGSFAAQGYIVVAPDYIGLGADYKSMHPYVVYPGVNAITGLYSLQAAMEILHREKVINNTDHYKLFTGGYSEGGAYALETSRLAQTDYKEFLQKNQLTIAAAAPAEGAYSLSDAQMNFDFADLKDGLTNKDIPNGYTEESFASQHLDNLLDCSNLANDPDADYKKCAGGTAYQKSNNTWNIGSSLMAAVAKPYIVSYALTAYGYYSLHNLASSYDILMPRDFWGNIPLLNHQTYKPTGKYVNILQFFMDPSLTNSDTISLIAHTGYQKYNGRNYNSSSDLHVNLYGFACNDGTNCRDDIAFEVLKPIIEVAKKMEINFPLPISENMIKSFNPIPGLGVGQNNSAGAFVHDHIRSLDLFKKSMEDADTYRWTTNSPIYLLSVDYDSVVPSKHSDIAYEYMQPRSPNNIKRIKFHNFQISNHDRGILFQIPSPAATASDYLAKIPISDDIIQKQYDAYCEKKPKADMEKCKKDGEGEYGVKKILSNALQSMAAIPIDHTQAEPFTIVGALCAFEQGQPNSICKPM